MQQFKRQTTAGNRTIPSTPSRWPKFTDFKSNLGEWEAEKIHKQQALQTLRFIADFPIWQSCQPTAVPGGNYLQKPRGLGYCASSDDVTTDLCTAACCSQNSWKQSPSFLILKSRQDLGSDVVWYNLLSAFNSKKKTKTGSIQWGTLLFLSSVPCAKSCYWEVFAQGQWHETAQLFLYHINQK